MAIDGRIIIASVASLFAGLIGVVAADISTGLICYWLGWTVLILLAIWQDMK